MFQPTNYVDRLAEYIKKNLKKGYTLDSLKYSLMDQGYTRITVERAIEVVNKELAAEAPIIREKPKISYRVVEDSDENMIEKRGWFRKLFGG